MGKQMSNCEGIYEELERLKPVTLSDDVYAQFEPYFDSDLMCRGIISAEFIASVSEPEFFVQIELLFCPNKRVVWLALHHKKKRIRKKNLNRAMKIISKQKNTKRGDI